MTVMDPECYKVSFNTGRSSQIVFRCLNGTHELFSSYRSVSRLHAQQGTVMLIGWYQPWSWYSQKLESPTETKPCQLGWSSHLGPIEISIPCSDELRFCSDRSIQLHNMHQHPISMQWFVKYLLTLYRGIKTVSAPMQEMHFETKSAREKCLCL